MSDRIHHPLHEPNDEPRVKPTEAEVAEALHADACPEGPDPGEACTCSDYRREAGIVLSLFADQPTVAQVKAEAWDEGWRARPNARIIPGFDDPHGNPYRIEGGDR